MTSPGDSGLDLTYPALKWRTGSPRRPTSTSTPRPGLFGELPLPSDAVGSCLATCSSVRS